MMRKQHLRDDTRKVTLELPAGADATTPHLCASSTTGRWPNAYGDDDSIVQT